MDSHEVKSKWIHRKVDYNVNNHLRSYKAAISGLKIGFKYELNFIIELVLMLNVVLAGIFLGISKLEWIILIFCFGITLSAELMNTSIEALVELKQFNVIVKKVKDLASAAVLIIALMDIIVGLLIFVPYIRVIL
ncbi:MAG: diacylglycerol kinase family protein [Candidatus Dojkabacteria bacterium]|nr:diacylglycerol kinase family protein [Candidatus Dojkabacteria bacterium]